MALMREEIFGPILPVVGYDTEDEAIAYIASRPRPLALYCFGRDAAARERVLQRTHSGGVTINDWGWHVVNHDAPFGGIGNSGMGSYHGIEGFRELSHARTVFERQRFYPVGLFYPPYGGAAARTRIAQEISSHRQHSAREPAMSDPARQNPPLAGRTIAVTGGFGALGRAVGQVLVDAGAQVALLDRGNPREGLPAAALARGGVDLGEPDAARAALAKVAERFGGLDGLVNIAGGFAWEKIEGGSIDTWDRQYTMNLRTAVLTSQAALPLLLARKDGRGGGRIVNIGALAAEHAGVGMGAYTAAKAGVARLTEALAEELRDRGITVNALLPSTLDTPANRADMPQADASRWVAPAALARVIVFLLSDDAALETSFANAAQISVSHCEPWASRQLLPKLPGWMLRRDSPLLFRPRLDWQQWRWSLAFLRECNDRAFERNLRQLVALGRYSHAALKDLVAATGIEYHRLERGIAQYYTDRRALDEAATAAELMRRHEIGRASC